MKPPAAARLAWSVWAFTLALVATALALTAVNLGGLPIGYVGLAAAFLCFPTVGALIASRRPGNAVGWICCATFDAPWSTILPCRMDAAISRLQDQGIANDHHRSPGPWRARQRRAK
jgi:hypothetical protein